MSKKNAAVYLEAARRIAEKEAEFSCLAVRDAVEIGGSYYDCPLAMRYSDLFKLETSKVTHYLWAYGDESDASIVNIRVLMLCLMAAIEECS